MGDPAEMPELFVRPAMFQKHQVSPKPCVFIRIIVQWRDVHPFAVRQLDQRVGVEQTGITSADRLHPRAAHPLVIRVYANIGVRIFVALGELSIAPIFIADTPCFASLPALP